MNNWFFMWDTQTPFGWAALAGGRFGAKRLDFGFPTREACLKNARLFPDQHPEEKLRADHLIAHNGPGKGPAWLFPAIVAITRTFIGEHVPLDIPYDISSHTEFQQSIWHAAGNIPRSQTRTYAWIAKAVGRPGAARAAGNALNANPMPLIIPCHRIIKATGATGGFGMGSKMKKMLLELEKQSSSNY